MEDYYQTLGVADTASQDEIKKAFRKLSFECHPDKNPDNKEAEDKFKKINEAYQTLSDTDKRQEYELKRQYGEDSFDGFPSGFGHPAGIDEILESFGFNRRNHNPFGNDAFSQKRKSFDDDTVLTFQIPFGKLKNGQTTQFIAVRLLDCDACKGIGGKTKIKCGVCNGTGTVTSTVRKGMMVVSQSRPCAQCMMRGEIIQDVCKNCSGSGQIEQNETYEVSLSCKKVE